MGLKEQQLKSLNKKRNQTSTYLLSQWADTMTIDLGLLSPLNFLPSSIKNLRAGSCCKRN